eukprot:2433012-Pleurochrysis_carterae.AAC.1
MSRRGWQCHLCRPGDVWRGAHLDGRGDQREGRGWRDDPGAGRVAPDRAGERTTSRIVQEGRGASGEFPCMTSAGSKGRGVGVAG